MNTQNNTPEMKISVYNPTRNTRKAMNTATENMGNHYQCETRVNPNTYKTEHLVVFPDVQRGIIVPAEYYRDFMTHVRQNFFLGHERNIDWMNS